MMLKFCLPEYMTLNYDLNLFNFNVLINILQRVLITFRIKSQNYNMGSKTLYNLGHADLPSLVPGHNRPYTLPLNAHALSDL